MVEPTTVLWGQAIAYTLYVLAAMSVVGWFAYRITRAPAGRGVPPALFWAFFGMLVVSGIALHIVSYNTIPWTPQDVHRAGLETDKTFNVTMSAEGGQHLEMDGPFEIDCGDLVRFEVTSEDLTYGFGLFREDHSMVFQMQVLPGHTNDVVWEFTEDATYTIRSTEYSGPAPYHRGGFDLLEEDAVRVTGCAAEQ